MHSFSSQQKQVGPSIASSQKKPDVPVAEAKYYAGSTPRLDGTNGKELSSNFANIAVHPNETAGIETKLTVNKPGDEYERDADRVADDIMKMPAYNSLFLKPKPVSVPGLYRKSKIGNDSIILQRKENSLHPDLTKDEVSSYLGSLHLKGTALSENTRSFFEPRFGFDFSKVKIHNDGDAAKSSQSLNALAYTFGNHIVFNQNQFSPESDHGKRLLAHELTHVVQQNSTPNQNIPQIQCKRHKPPVQDDWSVEGPKDVPKPKTKIPKLRSWKTKVNSGELAKGTRRKQVDGAWHVFHGDKLIVSAMLYDLPPGEKERIQLSAYEDSTNGSGWSISPGNWKGDTITWSIDCGDFIDQTIIKASFKIDNNIDLLETHLEFFEHPFEPVLAASPSSVNLDTGDKSKINLSLENVLDAGTSKLKWDAKPDLNNIVAINSIKNESRGKAIVDIEGNGAGTGDIQGLLTVNWGKKDEISSIKIPVTVSSDAARSAQALHTLSERRRKGETIDDRTQITAENLALSASETLVSKTQKSHSNQINIIVTRILTQIGTIEQARANGYISAVNDLNAKGLDKEADYGAFTQSMMGNLLWAIAALIPAPALGLMATEGLIKFFTAKWTMSGPGQQAAINIIGSMMAQFSQGLPSGSSTSGLKIALQQTLTEINSRICNELRRTVYEYIAGAVSEAPPKVDTNIAQYMADLEIGIRNSLYGDVYKQDLNDGDLPSSSKIQLYARNQMLRQYIVTNAALYDGGLAAIQGLGDRVQMGDAVSLVGGAGKLKIQPYELVVNQINTVSQEMGCRVNIVPETVTKLLAGGQDIYLDVANFDKWKVFGGGMPTYWMNPLMMKKIVSLQPEFSDEAYLSTNNIASITKIIVLQKDIESTKIDGEIVYSTKNIRFAAHGTGEKEHEFIPVDAPMDFEIQYHVKPK